MATTTKLKNTQKTNQAVVEKLEAIRTRIKQKRATAAAQWTILEFCVGAGLPYPRIANQGN